MREAMLYEPLASGKVRCELCRHYCVIADGRDGICRVRANVGGTLYTLVYGRAIAANVDPIEKKPLFHFHPGSRSYSIATAGCNFQCAFCQNWDISQMPKGGRRLAGRWFPPEAVVAAALATGCASIAYTYTEPTIFFEYAYDTAQLAHEAGLKNVFVSNGYMTEKALRRIAPYLDAINVDVKGFSEARYKRVMKARLQPVLESLHVIKALGIWLEVTTLVIPTISDDEAGLRGIAAAIVDLDAGTPWHVTQFHPDYRLTELPRTPLETLQRARHLGLDAGLRYVYCGNVPGEEGENTFCWGCGALLIERWGYRTKVIGLREGACGRCGSKIDGAGLP
ncbi:MAG: AmmeMemoRadiSam system radical SAM enzyme [Candidatus Tectomicrobia bacterium]|nr:AmmeMemoRadiSam system radical SAM enzyme [Candidatus Tectomicrobia bacterium]